MQEELEAVERVTHPQRRVSPWNIASNNLGEAPVRGYNTKIVLHQMRLKTSRIGEVVSMSALLGNMKASEEARMACITTCSPRMFIRCRF